MKYEYFVSYNYKNNNGYDGFGNVYVTTDTLLDCRQKIMCTARDIEKTQNLKTVIILNFILLNPKREIQINANLQ